MNTTAPTDLLHPFGPHIWLADGGAIVAMAGFHYPTRMVVIRLADGGLWVWSPIALSDALRTQVAALGPVAHLVAPNDLHHMFLLDWIAAFPGACVHAAPGLREKRADLVIDTVLGNDPPNDWQGQIDQVAIRGNKITTEVVFRHRASGTVLFTDLLQQMPRGWYRGWRALVARLDLMTGDEPAVPRKFRMAFSDKPSARRALDRILAWPVRAVVMAHGTPVTADAPGFLRRAFAWLM
ncbi:MAG: DUF4336 domain-containing protein [Rhodobacteraceae bacterium]|nr:DUF4336 domain-containing protein [Paracoccaceae bacterium]